MTAPAIYHYELPELRDCIADVRRRLQYLDQTLHQSAEPTMKQNEAWDLYQANAVELERLWMLFTLGTVAEP